MMFEAKDEEILGMDTHELSQQFLTAMESAGVKYLHDEWAMMPNRVKIEKLLGVEQAEVGKFGPYVNSIFREIHAFAWMYSNT